MANQKQVSVISSIITLYDAGWPKLKIAGHLGIDVKTVRRYIRQAQEASKSPQVPAGSEATGDSKSPQVPAGSGPPKSLQVPAGSERSRSRCELHRAFIEGSLDKGLSAQRIYQDLVIEEAFEGSYDAVKRFCRKLKATDPQRIWRMECLPGEEAQVDFGSGYYLEQEGKKHKVHLLRVVLSHSRKAYTEAVSRQTAELFIRCLENAFRHFGGVPQTVLVDNLRAAVKKADWYEPELTPKIDSFCRHYGTAILPCRPYTPEHKGKVENGVKYVKDNALKGRVFVSLRELNTHLQQWERTVADTRIHGTTRKQVRRCFEDIEKPALLGLPRDLFPSFQEGQRSVHRDSYVEVARAYYEVPPEYIGQQVWVRWDGRLVRIYNRQFKAIATLARKEPGQFSSKLSARGRPDPCVERSQAYWLKRCAQAGEACGLWALEVVSHKREPAIRTLQGLLGLLHKHGSRLINDACNRALASGAYRLKDLRQIMAHTQGQQSIPFMENHPLIRDMKQYAEFLETLHPEEITP